MARKERTKAQKAAARKWQRRKDREFQESELVYQFESTTWRTRGCLCGAGPAQIAFARKVVTPGTLTTSGKSETEYHYKCSVCSLDYLIEQNK